MNATAATILLLTGLSGPQPALEVLPPPRADEELLPAPRPVPRAERRLEQAMPPLSFYRPSAYDVWQLYSVTPTGFWRARVIQTPEGAFYLYNGEPYGWTSFRTRNHVP